MHQAAAERERRGLSNSSSSSDPPVQPAAGAGLQAAPPRAEFVEPGASRELLIHAGVKHCSRYESSVGVSLGEVLSLMWYILAISRCNMEWK